MKTRRTGLVSASTKEFFVEARKLKGYSLFDWLHGYIYSRWPYFYISVGTGEHPLARTIAPLAGKVITLFAKPSKAGAPQDAGMTFANTYHGKVVPLESAKQLVRVNEEISTALPETILPYDRARDLILKNPQHIVVLDCPCRVARKTPCLPLDVCLIVGEPFASFVSEHHPRRSRRISSDEAVDILKAEDQRGHVHHAFFKDAMLGRFYAICNCCDCCCGAMQAQRSGTPMLASSGYVAQIDAARCTGCGICEKPCQFHAISIPSKSKGDRRPAIIDLSRCMGCGICVSQCKRKAVALRKEPSKGEPFEIMKLIEAADKASS